MCHQYLQPPPFSFVNCYIFSRFFCGQGHCTQGFCLWPRGIKAAAVQQSHILQYDLLLTNPRVCPSPWKHSNGTSTSLSTHGYVILLNDALVVPPPWCWCLSMTSSLATPPPCLILLIITWVCSPSWRRRDHALTWKYQLLLFLIPPLLLLLLLIGAAWILLFLLVPLLRIPSTSLINNDDMTCCNWCRVELRPTGAWRNSSHPIRIEIGSRGGRMNVT